MIFVDTSAFVAAFAATDTNHSAAQDVFRRMASASDGLVTTNLVLVETASLLQRRLGFEAAARFVTVFLRPIDVLIVDRALLDAAIGEWMTSRRRQLSLVDCVSFALMRQHQIEQAFTFDRDFSKAGFALIDGVS